MTRYSEKVKRAAVQAYLTGNRGLAATAEAQGVGVHSLRSWVANYQVHGDAGLEKRAKKAYDAEFKLRVLQRVREEGLSYRQAGALFGVRRFDQIGAWERAFRDNGVAGLAPRHGNTEAMKKNIKRPPPSEGDDKHPSPQELVREIEQLRMENAYLKKLDALVQARSKSAPKRGR